MSDWLNPNPAAEVVAPHVNDKARRSPYELTQVVAQFTVATAERYRPRDVTGDALPETFCNYFVRDVLRSMGVTIPLRICNELHSWFLTLGEFDGWAQVSSGWVAQALAEKGIPAVAVWRNLAGGHGHIALFVPWTSGLISPTRSYVAQAGATRSSCMPFENAFGSRKPLFFAHE